MTDLIRAYAFPEKHAVVILIDLIVSDGKVDQGLVDTMLEEGEDPATMKPIVVIKHPKHDIYAVLDGHHRLFAVRQSGAKTIRAAVVDDYVGLGFELTRRGAFQPSPVFTRNVRVPAKRLAKYMERFLQEPLEMLREDLDSLRPRT